MFTLIYKRDGESLRHVLPPGESVAGRTGGCDLQIEDPSISRRHARFCVTGGGCTLTDLGTRNGTIVNEERVHETAISDGDLIVLGRVAFRVDCSPEHYVGLAEDSWTPGLPGTLCRRIDDTRETLLSARANAEGHRLVLLLTEISRGLVRWNSLPDLLERIVSVVFDTVPVERVFLLLRDESGGGLMPKVARSRSGEPLSAAILSRTVLDRVMGERLAVLANDISSEGRLVGADSLARGGIRSFMCVPLWSQTEVIGVLYTDNPHTAQLAAADLDVLQALAAYAAVVIEQARLTARVGRETRQRERLQRYHSTAVVDRILRDGGGADAPFLAEGRDVTVLFADIVGFTSMAERMEPSAVAATLNRCLTVMCEAVFAYDGTLDKFIGDEVMAVFGAPLEQSDHAARAVEAALAMRRAMDTLEDGPPMVLRIALNSGPATVGDIGSPKRREYTVLGDVVNTCARVISGSCAPGQIVMTGATRERMTDTGRLKSLGVRRIRGRQQEVELFEVL